MCEKEENFVDYPSFVQVKVSKSFYFYSKMLTRKIRANVLYLDTLGNSVQELIEKTNHYSNIQKLLKCILDNQMFFDRVVLYKTNRFSELEEAGADYSLYLKHFLAEFNFIEGNNNPHTVQRVLMQCYREWSLEGAEERNASFRPIIDEIRKHFPVDKKCAKDIKILVPGAGLGRLPFEIARYGYTCEGNENSVEMIFMSTYLFCGLIGKNEFTIYPFLITDHNNMFFEDQVNEIKFPDVSLLKVMENFSMSCGNFSNLYAGVNNEWNCVATCFFIDCVENVIELIQIIHRVLKPGGIWINMGPLMYHHDVFDSPKGLSLSFEAIKQVITTIGFEFEMCEVNVSTPYCNNPNSMHPTVYKSVCFTCKKICIPHQNIQEQVRSNDENRPSRKRKRTDRSRSILHHISVSLKRRAFAENTGRHSRGDVKRRSFTENENGRRSRSVTQAIHCGFSRGNVKRRSFTENENGRRSRLVTQAVHRNYDKNDVKRRAFTENENGHRSRLVTEAVHHNYLRDDVKRRSFTENKNGHRSRLVTEAVHRDYVIGDVKRRSFTENENGHRSTSVTRPIHYHHTGGDVKRRSFTKNENEHQSRSVTRPILSDHYGGYIKRRAFTENENGRHSRSVTPIRHNNSKGYVERRAFTENENERRSRSVTPIRHNNSKGYVERRAFTENGKRHHHRRSYSRSAVQPQSRSPMYRSESPVVVLKSVINQPCSSSANRNCPKPVVKYCSSSNGRRPSKVESFRKGRQNSGQLEPDKRSSSKGCLLDKSTERSWDYKRRNSNDDGH